MRTSFDPNLNLFSSSFECRLNYPENAAWRTHSSWYQISEQDKMINPELQRFMAKRMGAKTVSLEASHASAVSHPGEIAELIADAAGSPALKSDVA
jgi:hypothetical protein